MDCGSSPDFYSLNSRIGSDEPFHTDSFINFASRRTGGSTAVTIGGSTSRVSRVDTAPDGQLGSPSQARVKAVKPDDISGKQRGKFGTSSSIRVGNTLLANALFVEVPTFVAKDVEPSDRPVAETEKPAVESTAKSPTSINSSGKNVLSRRRGGIKKKNQTYGSRLREEGYLPASAKKPSAYEKKDGVLSVEGSGEGTSSEGAGYLPTETSDTTSSTDRGSYLPEPAAEDGSSSPPKGRYLPDEGTTLSDSSNSLSEEPPQSSADTSFLLPPPSSPELPNSILGAFALPEVDEYSPEPATTAPPRLPPMNLLPLSNEPPPPTSESRLPSTTESYGVLDEQDAAEIAATPSSGNFGRRRRPGDQNDVTVGREITQKPSEEPFTTSPPQEFQYNFDRVRSTLQDRLKNVEPFDVPADTLETSDGTTVASPSGSSRGSGVGPSPWLFSLAKLPM